MTVVEDEYREAMLQAELRWTESIVDQLRARIAAAAASRRALTT